MVSCHRVAKWKERPLYVAAHYRPTIPAWRVYCVRVCGWHLHLHGYEDLGYGAASSKKVRSYHACVEHDGYVWIGGGDNDATTEKYDPDTNTWINGPDLPKDSSYPGVLMSNYGLLTYTGGSDNKNIYQRITEQKGWIKVFKSLSIYEIIQALLDRRDDQE